MQPCSWPLASEKAVFCNDVGNEVEIDSFKTKYVCLKNLLLLYRFLIDEDEDTFKLELKEAFRMYDKVIQNHKNDTIAEKYKYIYISRWELLQNIAKGKTDPRVEFIQTPKSGHTAREGALGQI